jgi:hypothetical protein
VNRFLIERLKGFSQAVSLSPHGMHIQTEVGKRLNMFPHGRATDTKLFTKRLPRMETAIRQQLD